MQKRIIEDILSKVDLSGFTRLLQGDKLGRYIVGLTNNTQFDTTTLASQATRVGKVFANVTIGGRQSPSAELFVDIGTAIDSKSEALRLAKAYDQQAIRDRKESKEIFVS